MQIRPETKIKRPFLLMVIEVSGMWLVITPSHTLKHEKTEKDIFTIIGVPRHVNTIGKVAE
jgi:hypothetical protein